MRSVEWSQLEMGVCLWIEQYSHLEHCWFVPNRGGRYTAANVPPDLLDLIFPYAILSFIFPYSILSFIFPRLTPVSIRYAS